MAHLILPEANLQSIIRRRRKLRLDRLDEVWNGVYVMAPEPSNEHQDFAGFLYFAIRDGLRGIPGAKVYPPINVSDRAEDWTKNYRCPDLSVFLAGNPAEDRKTHWFNGPDFVVEIISKGDRSRRKLDFYAKVGVQEILLVNRFPWRLELYRNLDGMLKPAQTLTAADSERIASAILPVSFRLLESNDRVRIEVTQTVDGRVWLS